MENVINNAGMEDENDNITIIQNGLNGDIHSHRQHEPIKIPIELRDETRVEACTIVNRIVVNDPTDMCVNNHEDNTKSDTNNDAITFSAKPPIPSTKRCRSPSDVMRIKSPRMKKVNSLTHVRSESRNIPPTSKSDSNFKETFRESPVRHLNTNELDSLRKELEMIKIRLTEMDTGRISTDYVNKEEKPEMVLTTQQRANRNRVLINIGGIRHETYRSTLKNIPDTRLSWIAEESAIHSPEYDPINQEFFFDRHPQVFSHILNYYRTGNLHVPYDVCGPLFEDELSYWGIDDSQVESCCWLSYRQHRDAQETLKEFEGIEFEKDFDDDSEPDLSKYGFNIEEADEMNEELTWWQKWQPVLWKLMEDPYSSLKAKIWASISMSLILLSVVLFCLETMAYFKDKQTALTALEGICVFFFSIELTIRFIFCPDKILFLKGVMNWIDLLSIIPFFLTIILKYGFKRDSENVTYLQSIRVIRVFRIIKLSRHSVGLQILGHTLKASFRELLLLIFFLIIGIVISSSLVYYCEHREPKTKFVDIPTTFWWAVITMTTVGYGDMVPTSTLGKLIGAICSVCGVLMIALPVPVIVNNFNLYYSHAQARLKLPKKKRRMLCGAANALKGPALDEFDRREFEEGLEEQEDDEDDEDDVSRNGEEEEERKRRCNNNNNHIKELNSSEENLSHDGSKPPNFLVEISATTDSEDEHSKDSHRLAAMRLKRFSRRDSNMFASQKQKNGDLSPHSGKSPYALHKRRSLLPSMNSLPEIDQ